MKSTESKKFNSTEVPYYLSEPTSEIGAWARATLKSKDPFKADPNPKLEIAIFGNPKGVSPPKPDGEIIGQWEDYTLARTFETLCRTKDGLKMNSTSGETGKTVSDEPVTAKKEGNRIIIRPIKKADDNDEYWILDEAKNLLFMDAQGNTGKAMAVAKPTLKLDGSNGAKPAKDTVTTSAFATADEAKSEAIRRYPDLAVAGSAFNREFLAQYKRYQQERPSFFNDTSWPIRLAEEASKSVGGGGGNSYGGATPASKALK